MRFGGIIYYNLLPLYERKKTHDAQKRIFELREIVHRNCHVSDIWQEPPNFANYVTSFKPLEVFIE